MNSCVDILSHEAEGFKILVQFGSWRTAVYNSGKNNTPATFGYVEKHKESDEVFVLLKGKAYMVTAGNGEDPAPFELIPLEVHKTYNVRAGAWHAVLMSGDASFYLVENADTGQKNSGYYHLTGEEKEKLLARVQL